MASFKDNPGPVFCPETLKIEISDERDSELDRLIKDSWQCRMTNGHFRYDISDVRTRIVGKFVCQVYTPWTAWQLTSVTRLGDLLDFGQLFKAFGNN